NALVFFFTFIAGQTVITVSNTDIAYLRLFSEQLDLKEESDTLMEITIYEENEKTEADLNKYRSHVQNVDSSHMSVFRCDSDVRKHFKEAILGKKYKQSPKEKSLSSVKSDEGTRITHNMTLHARAESDDGPHVCEECNKSFSYKSRLRLHMITHTGQKPFSCKNCDKSFRQISDLTKHMRTHTGEKPFSCKECDKSFIQISDVNKHMRTHTGEKPYLCKECDKNFSQISPNPPFTLPPFNTYNP
uniref:C2H2-type domain-containing protein n=1 Tax=Oryzias melastigma TaxID=30732 RepID=A0A3B3CJK4_ORYME